VRCIGVPVKTFVGGENASPHVFRLHGESLLLRPATSKFLISQWVKGKSLRRFCRDGPVVVTLRVRRGPQSNAYLRITRRDRSAKPPAGDDFRQIFPVAGCWSNLSQAHDDSEAGDIIAPNTGRRPVSASTPPEYASRMAISSTECAAIGMLRNQDQPLVPTNYCTNSDSQCMCWPVFFALLRFVILSPSCPSVRTCLESARRRAGHPRATEHYPPALALTPMPAGINSPGTGNGHLQNCTVNDALAVRRGREKSVMKDVKGRVAVSPAYREGPADCPVTIRKGRWYDDREERPRERGALAPARPRAIVLGTRGSFSSFVARDEGIIMSREPPRPSYRAERA